MKKILFKTALLCFAAIMTVFSITGCTNSADELNETQRQTQSSAQNTQASASEPTETNTEENDMSTIKITINGESFTAELYDNDAAKEFASMLPMTVDASDLHSNEKYYYLSETLPTDASRPDMIHTGDLMLYSNNCIVLFYKDFSTSYSYTPLGRITDTKGLENAVGKSSVRITFEAAE